MSSRLSVALASGPPGGRQRHSPVHGNFRHQAAGPR